MEISVYEHHSAVPINANIREMQSGASSLAKHEYDFSIVYEFVKDPIVSPGLYENQEC